MSWWRRREPAAPRGRRHAGAAPAPEILADHLTGMLSAYVPSGAEPGRDAWRHAPYDTRTAGPDPVAASHGVGSVVLGFADGSSVAFAPGDSRTRPFLALTDALTSG